MSELQKKLPKIEIPKEYETENDYLRGLVESGLKNRYCEITPEIRSRADYEMETIFENEFSVYFLVAWEFVTWAKSSWDYVNKKPKPVILVGPGRGAGASSIVSYCMGITDVAPIKYGLVFERVVNPDLVEVKMPNFNIDVDADYRELAIQHLRDLYGDTRVGNIVTFGRGEGTDRKSGIHASGIVVTDSDLTDYVPVFKDPKTGKIVTQCTRDFLEQCGFVIFDFMSLGILTLIRKTENLINENKSPDEKEFKIEDIPIDDSEVFELFSRGDTDDIFQFESPWMQKWLKKLRATCFEDLVAINSLYRPGPLDYIPMFIKGKRKPDSIKYLDPCLEEILKETYGIMVYQEQVIKAVNKISGLSLGDADLVRRSMLKKNIEVKDIAKEKFITGATKNGFSKERADEIFEKMVPFANFAFCKSHAVCYTMLAYRAAWLKCHYKKEFDFVRGEKNFS